MTWKAYFESAQRKALGVSFGRQLWQIHAVGDELLILSFGQDREVVSYKSIRSVGEYAENPGIINLYMLPAVEEMPEIEDA